MPEAEPLLSLDTKLDILGVACIIVALVTLLSILSSSPGALTYFWLTFIRQMFGWGGYLVPVVVGAAGVWLIWRHFGDQLPPIHPLRITGGVLLFLGTLTLTQAITVAVHPLGEVYYNPAYADPSAQGYTPSLVWDKAIACPAGPQQLLSQGWRVTNGYWTSYDIAACGYGGGYIGAFIQMQLSNLFSDLPVFVIAIAAVLAGILLVAQMTLKEALLKSRDQIQALRDRQAGVAPATAYQRNEKGELVPVQREGEAEQPKKPGPEPPKKDQKPAAPVPSAPGTAAAATVAPPVVGRPSIVTGRGPGSSPTAPPPSAPGAPPPAPAGAPAAAKPGGATGPLAPAKPMPPSGAPGSGLPKPPSPAPAGGAPNLTVPPRPGDTGRLPGAPGSGGPAPQAAPIPAIPGAGSAKPPEASAAPKPGGLPAAAPRVPSASGAAAPAAEKPVDDEEDDEGQPSGPGGKAPPAPVKPAGPSALGATPRPPSGQLPTGTRPGGDMPPARPMPGALPVPGKGPGATQGRTFGPGMPGSIGGKSAADKTPAPVRLPIPAKSGPAPDPLDALRPKGSETVKSSPAGEEPAPPSDQMIKELVEDKPLPAPDAKPEPPKPADKVSVGAVSVGPKADDGEKPKLASAVGLAVPPAPSAPLPRPAPKPEAVQPPASPSAKAKASAPAPVASAAAKTIPSVKGDEKRSWNLPDVDVLQLAVEKSISDEELRQRAMIIEQTLSSFGAPGRVVEVNHGPVITQFGVEPDYLDIRAGKRIKVKVGKISALADDLALALAAPSIRIEAPVPGKGYVGIEVPNAQPGIVGLRDVMDTHEFRNLKSPLRLALGQDVSGTPIVADLTAMPHLLIAGTTGSGKSVCVNGIICTLLMTCTPDDLKVIMVDPKRVELTNYNGIPHLMAPVVTDLERIVGVLKWVQREMDDRYRTFAMEGARNITDYNARVARGQAKGEKLAYILVIVDELADLMMLAPDETERVITRLAQMARATGIHIIISTQRPSVDVVTGLIKANFPARIAFAVATGVDSRVILDMPGAEKLLGRGDMLFQAPDAPMPVRMQGVFLADREIQKIVDYWKAQAAERGHTPPALQIGATPTGLGTGPLSSTGVPGVQKRLFESEEDAQGSDSDDLFDEAVELVRGMEKASISLLQRHLRIGYTRAARLIDLMEQRGVIGPHEGGSKPRVVLGPDGKPLRDLGDEEEDGEEI